MSTVTRRSCATLVRACNADITLGWKLQTAGADLMSRPRTVAPANAITRDAGAAAREGSTTGPLDGYV